MKKLFSILLAMAMLFSVSIVPAFAASTTCEIIVEYAEALVPGKATTMTLTINVDDDTDKIMAPYIIFNATGFESIEMTGASDFLETERAFVLQDYGYELQGYNGTGYPDGTSFTFSVLPSSADASIEFDVESSAVSTAAADVFLDTITVKVPAPAAPAVEWIPVSASVVELTGDDPEAVDYAYGINTTCPGAVQMIFAADVDGARKYSQAFSAEGTEGSVNYGFYAGTTQYGNVSVLFRDAAEKEDTTKIWYSNALDLANKE